jgi:hypothetical protein
MEKTKEQRLQDINELIKVIGSKDRKFLSSHADSKNPNTEVFYSYFFIKGKFLYFVDSYTRKEILIRANDWENPREFSHGGTMWGLIKDFRDYILTGNYTNHKHGYGGLYCPHWGYSEKSMQEIRDFAISIDYLYGDYKHDMECSKMSNDGINFSIGEGLKLLPLETKSEEVKQEAMQSQARYLGYPA